MLLFNCALWISVNLRKLKTEKGVCRTRHGWLLSCVTHLPVDHLFGPVTHHQCIKYDAISAGVVRDIVMDKSIHQPEKWASIYVLYKVSVCPLSLSHTHELAVEWYSSYLDEIRAVSEPSLLPGSASPSSASPSASFSAFCTALSTFSHPDRCFSHLGLKMRRGVIDHLHCDGYNF